MPRSPQQIAARLNADRLASLQGDPALRLSGTTGRRIFGGGGIQPQHFLRPPQPNDPASIEHVASSINTRRALNRARGRI